MLRAGRKKVIYELLNFKKGITLTTIIEKLEKQDIYLSRKVVSTYLSGLKQKGLVSGSDKGKAKKWVKLPIPNSLIPNSKVTNVTHYSTVRLNHVLAAARSARQGLIQSEKALIELEDLVVKILEADTLLCQQFKQAPIKHKGQTLYYKTKRKC